MQLLPSLLSELKCRMSRLFLTREEGRGRRLRPLGFRNVFHAGRVVSPFSARAGEGPWPLQLPDAVRDRSNPFGQLYPRSGWTRPTPRFCSLVLERMETLLTEPSIRQAFSRLDGRTLVRIGIGPSISARESSAVRTVSPATVPTAGPRTIIACCPRRSWRPAIPRSFP